MNLDIKNVSISFGKKVILDKLSIPSIQPGEMVALIGKNGAGKSTLLRHMTKNRRSTNKDILFNNQPLVQKDIGYLPQDHRIFASMTVLELLITLQNLDSSSLLTKQYSAEHGLTLLNSMGIIHLANKICTELSGGESQMVGLAQALINRPSILILDEPTSALDMHNQLKLLEYVKYYATVNQACVLMVIHDLNLAIQYSDKVAALHQGKLLSYGGPREIITSELIWQIFDVDSDIIEVNNHPIVVTKTSRKIAAT